MTKSHFAFFVPSMRGGGAERATLTVARGIVERGYSVDLLLAQAEGPYLAEVPDSVRLVDLKASRVILALPALIFYLRKRCPASLFSVMTHTNIVALWARALAGVPTRVVISERTSLSYSFRRSSSWKGKFMPYFVRLFYPLADEIVAVSKGVAEDLARTARIPSQRIKVVYNAIVRPDLWEKTKSPVDHPWFQEKDIPVILAVGRLSDKKDYPTLIKAFARVRQRRKLRLLILGEGRERAKLETLIKQLGLERDVSLPGFQKNPYAYLSHASLFILSSRCEGLPGVLIEAMTCGVPLISTDCPNGPREILDNGKYGKLVPVANVNALAEAIEDFLEGKLPAPPKESWRSFELKTVVDQYLKILQGQE